MNAMTYTVRKTMAAALVAKVSADGEQNVTVLKNRIAAALKAMVVEMAASYRAKGHETAADRMVASFGAPERTHTQTVAQYADTGLGMVGQLGDRHSRPEGAVLAIVTAACQ